MSVRKALPSGTTAAIVTGGPLLVEVHGAAVRTELDFHRALTRQLDFGRYGHNLDALWDRLSADVERPVHLVWHDADLSRQQLGSDLFARICRILDKVVEQDERFGRDDRFTYQLR